MQLGGAICLLEPATASNGSLATWQPVGGVNQTVVKLGCGSSGLTNTFEQGGN